MTKPRCKTLTGCTLMLGVAAMTLSAHAQDGAMMNNGMMMSGDNTAMPMASSGSIVRRYVDRDGNVTALDVRTNTGVVLMRLPQAVMITPQNMAMYRMGAAMDLDAATMGGMREEGVLRYDPDNDGPLMMGRTKMVGNTTGGRSVVAEGLLGKDMQMSAMNGQMMNGNMAMSSGTMMKGMFKGSRLMMVATDGQMMNVTMRGNRTMVATSTGSLELMRDANGSYVIPESMTGARMMLVLRDGQQLPVDSANGQLMVTLSDGTMRPINNKGKVVN